MTYSQQETERRRDQQTRLIFKLQNDVALLKELLQEEKLANQKLRTEIDKVRLQKEIESPTYKLHQLKFKMERERVGLEEAKAKLEKQVYRLEEELTEVKSFYEERLRQMDLTIKRLQASLASRAAQPSSHFGFKHNIHLTGLNRIEMMESLNESSLGLNGTSLEDIKELTLNMKVPTSFNKKTKTEAEVTSQLHGRADSRTGADGQSNDGAEHLEIAEIAEEDIESNYVTNGSYAQGIPSSNRGILNQ